MDNAIERLVIEFFRSLKCDVSCDSGVWNISGVPKSFEDFYGKPSPYSLRFSSEISGGDFVGRGSELVSKISKYLENAGRTTLLKIDFDVDPMAEIGKAISLKNCSVWNVLKKHRNNFFSRFTFMTTFRYLNEQEQVVNEIYVHDGEVVTGDLGGYEVIEGDSEEASTNHLESDYPVAKGAVKGLIDGKVSEISRILGEKLQLEISRIQAHYDNLLAELGGDLAEHLNKIEQTELELRTAEGDEAEVLRNRVARLRANLVKIGNDDSRDRILKEQDFTVRDARNKHSLSVDNKLINTTVIYYPVFEFDLLLKNDSSQRLIKMAYNPMTKTLDDLKCDSCGEKISRLNLCSSGHVVCDNCLGHCGECGKQFCASCLSRSCSVCGKALCKNCLRICHGCGNSVCNNCLRKDCVSGEERCVRCLRACLRCHGMSEEKFFGEALDGSKVCQKCLGAERRDKIMKNLFR